MTCCDTFWRLENADGVMPPCWGLSVHKSRSHPCCSRRGWLFLSLICCDRQKMRFPPRWLFEVSGTGLAIRQQVQPPVPGAEPGQRPKGCQRANLRAPTTKSPSRLSCETLQVAGTPQGRRLSREHRFASVVNEPRGDCASRRSHNPPFRRTAQVFGTVQKRNTGQSAITFEAKIGWTFSALINGLLCKPATAIPTNSNCVRIVRTPTVPRR